jgi:GT2 family glycosyltransferase
MSDGISTFRKIAVVTPVHNRKDLTLLCLRSLFRADLTGIGLSVYIVDDGSSDGTEEAIAEAYPEVTVIRGDGNLWFTGGMNFGIEAAMSADPDYVLAINNDSIFDQDFLQLMLRCAEQNPRSIVGALLLLWDQPHRVFQVAPRWETFSGGYRHWQRQTVWTVPDRPWRVELIVGNCVLFPAEAISECGLMNARKFPHYGDAEYTPRMRRMGWQLLIEPAARVFCQPNTAPPSVAKMGIRRKLQVLFLDHGNANSFRRRLYANIYGGPNIVAGIIAFLIFYLRYIFGKNLEGTYGSKVEEPPLSEIYADRVLRSR